ncbi:MAG: hypothetical protein IJ043_07830 [Clostridia bacterium]|nr:hypothetical protein [Clostridia bacterium]
MKLRKILAVLMIIAVLVTLAGCNYVQRPSGAANNGSDISGKLSDLLIIPTFQYQDAPLGDKEYIYNGPPIEEPEPDDGDDEPIVEPDPVLDPFSSTYDANKLLSMIAEQMETMKTERGVANSATGVSDELLAGRSIKILVPDDFPIEEENEAVKAMSAQYGVAINVRRVGTGSAYTAACRRAYLAGDDVDLIYVDNGNWGDIQSFTQSINNYVNFELGDELNTFSSSYSTQFFVQDDLDENLVYYHVASGIGAPYLLAYNKANIKTATLASAIEEKGTEVVTYREIAVTDPVEMYNNRTWSIGALTELLKASTSGTNVGIASELDALNGLDIWYGMENAAGFKLSFSTGKASLTLNAAQSETLDDVQAWYWTNVGTDKKNYTGAFEKASAWEDETVFTKLFNRYNGTDAVKSYSMVGCELDDLDNLVTMGTATASDWDFVAYPYGQTYEDTYRALTAEEFDTMVKSDAENAEDPEYDKEVITPVAGWAGGFAVMKTCKNASVALRVAEEYTKIWKAENETPYLDLLTDDQKARYAEMQDNIAISFVRAWAEKAADVNEVYPGYADYFYGIGTSSTANITNQDPDAYATERAYYKALSFFDGNSALAVHPMYHKNEPANIYVPSIHTTYSAFMEGAPSQVADNVKDSGRVVQILNASLLPGIVLFQW